MLEWLRETLEWLDGVVRYGNAIFALVGIVFLAVALPVGAFLLVRCWWRNGFIDTTRDDPCYGGGGAAKAEASLPEDYETEPCSTCEGGGVVGVEGHPGEGGYHQVECPDCDGDGEVIPAKEEDRND